MKRLEVTFINGNAAAVSGYGSMELLTELRSRRPIYSSLSRAWMTSPRTARDLIAIAEARGYDVTVGFDDPLPAARGVLF